jgi:hypothetical protein
VAVREIPLALQASISNIPSQLYFQPGCCGRTLGTHKAPLDSLASNSMYSAGNYICVTEHTKIPDDPVGTLEFMGGTNLPTKHYVCIRDNDTKHFIISYVDRELEKEIYGADEEARRPAKLAPSPRPKADTLDW